MNQNKRQVGLINHGKNLPHKEIFKNFLKI